eukprot:TRINITY_DN51247_c0_g1_i1.p1 TRINITY_DN51247_c0_g1~~TRINITY_DN51247_c0_g1_i1.p1  ORF type:complete len:590 (+),score=172.19 TRINITY_DN51247_c0_g1_i1:172-1770(+)
MEDTATPLINTSVREAVLNMQQRAIVTLHDPDGVWELDKAGAKLAFQQIDRGGDGQISLDELLDAVQDPVIRAWLVDSKCLVLKGLLNPDLKEEMAAFERIDTSGDQKISLEEWMAFIRRVGAQRLSYLEGKAHLTGQCYWGYTHGEACMVGRNGGPFCGCFGQTIGRCRQRGCCGSGTHRCIARGYWDDYWYYTMNNHPLISIFCVDRDHPLSRGERVIVELCAQGFSFMMSGMHDWRDHTNENSAWDFFWHPYVFSTVFVTIPGMIMHWMLVTFNTCPWPNCFFDKTAATKEQIAYMGKCNTAGHLASAIFVAGILVCIGLGFYMYFFDDPTVDRAQLKIWAYGRLQAYALWFVTVFFMDFNPFIRCSLQYVNFGRWETERRQIQGFLSEWVPADGYDLPDSPGVVRGCGHDEVAAEDYDSIWSLGCTGSALVSAAKVKEEDGTEHDPPPPTALQRLKERCIDHDCDAFVVRCRRGEPGTVAYKRCHAHATFDSIQSDGRLVREDGAIVWFRKRPQERHRAKGTKGASPH